MNTMGYSIREATYADAEIFSMLWHTHMQFHNLLDANIDNTTANDWKKWFKFTLCDQNCKIYVAEQNNNLIGYIIGHIKPIHPVLKNKYGEVAEVFVINEKHGKGVAKLLLKSLSEWFLNKDIKAIQIKASPTNHKENEMWESLGFKLHLLLLRLNIEEENVIYTKCKASLRGIDVTHELQDKQNVS